MVVALDAFRRTAPSAGVFLDVDGTLSPIVARPERAELAAGADAALVHLVERFRVVAAISGRTQQELRALIRAPGVRLVGSYGLDAGSITPALEAAVTATAVDVDGAWVESKGATIAVHYRASPDVDAAGRILERRLAALAATEGMELIEGKRVLELVPAGRPLKDGAVERILAEERIRAALYAGDDDADIRAFAALDRAVADRRLELAVKVAVRGSDTPEALVDAADVVVDGPAALVELLGTL